MPKLLMSSVAVIAALTLSGCSALYPNWGATGLPEEPIISSSVPGEAQETELEDSSASEPTESETAAAEPTESAPAEKQTVTVTVNSSDVYADEGLLVVDASAIDLVEAGGSCTLRVIGGGKEATLKVKAEASSTYTHCFPMEIELAGLPSGTAVMTVTYESETRKGTSETVSVVLP